MSLPSFFEIYNTLISIITISSVKNDKLDYANKSLLDHLATWFAELGFEITLSKVSNTREKYNLLASYYPKDKNAVGGLLLSGHSDTVPFDENRWTKNPFKITEQDNRWYGLGTADMKGFFAFVLESLKNIDLTKLDKPLHILATADEETTMAGAVYFANTTTLKPDFVVIGEPTSLIPIRAHKSYSSNVIQVIGQSGHSSDPDSGINAIEVMHLVIANLLKLKESLKQDYHNEGFTIPYPTMNLGMINGGDAANRICGCCELVLDIRALPEMNLNSLYDLVCSALQPIMAKYPDRIKINPFIKPIAGYECCKDNQSLKEVESLLQTASKTANYSTEAPHFSSLAPTIILGAGSIEQAHQPDEFVSIDFLKPTTKAITQLIMRFCG